MALKKPPFNDNTLQKDGSFTETWRAWLQRVREELNTISGGSP